MLGTEDKAWSLLSHTGSPCARLWLVVGCKKYLNLASWVLWGSRQVLHHLIQSLFLIASALFPWRAEPSQEYSSPWGAPFSNSSGVTAEGLQAIFKSCGCSWLSMWMKTAGRLLLLFKSHKGAMLVSLWKASAWLFISPQESPCERVIPSGWGISAPWVWSANHTLRPGQPVLTGARAP